MKKKYIEPIMVVEDFTVSEMIAATCQADVTLVNFSSQMSEPGNPFTCTMPDWTEKEAWEVQSLVNNMYESPGIGDRDGNGLVDTFFTNAYHSHSSNSEICTFDPIAAGHNFDVAETGSSFICSSDSTVLVNS